MTEGVCVYNETGIRKHIGQLKELAIKFEKAGFINRAIGVINSRISEDFTEEGIKKICRKKADVFWNTRMDRVILSHYLVEDADNVAINARNYGKDGIEFIKSAGTGNTENYLKARRIARDNHIANATYGSSNLRLKVKKFNSLADELSRSIDIIEENIRLFEDEAGSRSGQV